MFDKASPMSIVREVREDSCMLAPIHKGQFTNGFLLW